MLHARRRPGSWLNKRGREVRLLRFGTARSVLGNAPLLACVDESVYTDYADDMSETTTIRISRDTHARVTRLAAERHETIDEIVSKGIRALRQDAMARDLAADLSGEESAWLDADAG